MIYHLHPSLRNMSTSPKNAFSEGHRNDLGSISTGHSNLKVEVALHFGIVRSSYCFRKFLFAFLDCLELGFLFLSSLLESQIALSQMRVWILDPALNFFTAKKVVMFVGRKGQRSEDSPSLLQIVENL